MIEMIGKSKSIWEQKANQIIALGMKYLGTPYKFGAQPGETSQFDCSSFIQYIFGKNGIPLPRNSRQQSKIGVRVPKTRIRKGDILIFESERRKHKKGLARIGHVGIYLGNGKMLHAARDEGISVIRLSDYQNGKLVKVKRVIR